MIDSQIHELRAGQVGLAEQIAALEASFSSQLGVQQAQLGLLQASCASGQG